MKKMKVFLYKKIKINYFFAKINVKSSFFDKYSHFSKEFSEKTKEKCKNQKIRENQ